MSWVTRVAAAAAVVISAPRLVESALVDAGEFTSVYTSAPLFDARLGDDNGCDPAGCLGKLSRDGDSTHGMSRWSCKPELGPVGSTCAITYDLDAPLSLKQLRVGAAVKQSCLDGSSTVFSWEDLTLPIGLNVEYYALFKGDVRQRTLEVYVEGKLVTAWTSSGITSDFETIDLPGKPAQTVELRGVLSRSQWLSIIEVEILVEDGSTVEVGTLGAINTTATFYDTRVKNNNGCDPTGCEPSLTRDNKRNDHSRWSCAPKLGGVCSIAYDLEKAYEFYQIHLFLYKGASRIRTVEILVDGELVMAWTSSGTTDGFEVIEMSGSSGQVLEIRGDLSEPDMWLSIIETKILVYHDRLEPPRPTPETEVPVTRVTGDGRLIVEAGELDWVGLSWQSDYLYDSNLASEGGCDPLGCVKEYTRDGSLEENSRWACQFVPFGMSEFDLSRYQCRIFFDLVEPLEIYGVRVALFKGDEETKELEVWIDNVEWVTGWTSSGTTTGFEEILMPMPGIIGEDITIRATLEDGEWIGITEVAIDVVVDDVPLLGISASERVAVTATSDFGDPSVLLDGFSGSSMSWACIGEACSITFDLQTIQHVVQISLAFVEDGEIAANIFDVSVAYQEGGPFTKVLSDVPSNKDRPLTMQQFKVAELARYVRVSLSAFGSGLMDMTEVDIRISEDEPTYPVTTDASLVTSGLIPKAEGDEGDSRTEAEGGCGTRGCTLINVKDGDASTFWRCFGSPANLECSAYFRLAYPRRLKQIRIALTDGAERASEMVFEAGLSSEQRLCIINSGLTDGFETYDFDVFTSWVRISGRFRGVMEPISIAEVEFLIEDWAEGEIPVGHFSKPYQSPSEDDLTYLEGDSEYSWIDDEDAIGRFLSFDLAFYATVSAIELEFPLGQRYKFDIVVYDAKGEYEDGLKQEGFESEEMEGFQAFALDFVPDDLVLVKVAIIMMGTVAGDDAFALLEARVIGEHASNPTSVFSVASVAIEDWWGYLYPDFIGDGVADQEAIMGAICAVKEAEFDGVKCVGVSPDAAGEVSFMLGQYYVDGNIFAESKVHLNGRFSLYDSPHTTDIILTEGAAGNTNVPAIVVLDGIQDTAIDSLFVYGIYDPEVDNAFGAEPGLGSKGFEFTNCKNVSAHFIQARNVDGDGITVTESKLIAIDAGHYHEDYLPWQIIDNRGIGMLIQDSESVWIRRHTLYNNGVAGLVIKDSTNVAFEATYDTLGSPGQGSVGSLEGQQPLDISVEGSSMIKFDHVKVVSNNEPAIDVSPDSFDVSFFECGFESIASGTCVIEAGTPSEVTVTDSDGELNLVGFCFEKV